MSYAQDNESQNNINSLIWYQIFPERFRNGYEQNDPTISVIIDKPKNWSITNWGHDWYKLDKWEKQFSTNFYDIATKRRYGGDLIGVIEKLDYLDSLGVNVIYFNPIFDARTMHKYDATFYHHIDRYFGKDPVSDSLLISKEIHHQPHTWLWTTADSVFLSLIKEAHKKDIKIVLDGVFNHTGPHFWAFQDVIKNGEKSNFKDWYDIKSFDDPNTPQNEFDYHGWWGFKGLPEFLSINNDLHKDVKKHIFDITKRWMDPNNDGDPSDGIDGWRLDVAEEIGEKFWLDWHAFIKSINPQVFTVAEAWETNASAFISKTGFSGTMNYPLTRLIHRYFINNTITSKYFVDSLIKIHDLYTDSQNKFNLNILDSHDTERILTAIVNDSKVFKQESKLQDSSNQSYNIEAPSLSDIALFKMIIAFQYLLPGMPHIYYGNEVGMWGADDPDNRKPMIWNDLDYEVETTHPYGLERQKDSVKVNHDLYRYFNKLNLIRKSELVFSNGSTSFYEKEDRIYIRISNDNEIILGIFSHKNNKKLKLTDSIFLNKRIVDVISNRIYKNELIFIDSPFYLLKLSDAH